MTVLFLKETEPEYLPKNLQCAEKFYVHFRKKCVTRQSFLVLQMNTKENRDVSAEAENLVKPHYQVECWYKTQWAKCSPAKMFGKSSSRIHMKGQWRLPVKKELWLCISHWPEVTVTQETVVHQHRMKNHVTLLSGSWQIQTEFSGSCMFKPNCSAETAFPN